MKTLPEPRAKGFLHSDFASGDNIACVVMVPSALTDIMVDGGFDDVAAWTANDDWSVGASKATRVPGAGTSSIATATTLMTVGDYYLVTFDILTMTAGTVNAGFGTTNVTPALTAAGSYVGLGVVATAGNLLFDASAAANLTLDNVALYHLQEDLANNDTPVIERLDWSYDGTPAGYVQLAGPTGSLWREDIVTAGPDSRDFTNRGRRAGFVGTKNRALVALLGAGGAVTGKLNLKRK